MPSNSSKQQFLVEKVLNHCFNKAGCVCFLQRILSHSCAYCILPGMVQDQVGGISLEREQLGALEIQEQQVGSFSLCHTICFNRCSFNSKVAEYFVRLACQEVVKRRVQRGKKVAIGTKPDKRSPLVIKLPARPKVCAHGPFNYSDLIEPAKVTVCKDFDPVEMVASWDLEPLSKDDMWDLP